MSDDVTAEQVAKVIFMSRNSYPGKEQNWETREEGSMLDSQYMEYAEAVLDHFDVTARVSS